MPGGRLAVTLLGCAAVVAVTAAARPVIGPASAGSAVTAARSSGTAAGSGATAAGSSVTATPSPIKHVAILYLENQSFDSLLGFWCRHHSGRCPRGGMPRSVTLSDGSVVKPRAISRDVIPIVTHNVLTQLTVMNIQNGVPQMNGWQNMPDGHCDAASNYRCIVGYPPWKEPNLTTLATNFAVSDATFSLADSPSYGGHLYVLTSNLDGFLGDAPKSIRGQPGVGWGCDGNHVAVWAPTLGGTQSEQPSCIPDYSLTHNGAALPNGGAFEPTQVAQEPTILDELSKAGLKWTLYGGKCANENVATNGLKTCTSADHGYPWSICPLIAECLYGHASHMATPNQFLKHAAAGTLPAFSVITPAGNRYQASEHNGFSITAGDDWIGQIASAVENSPEWDSTALFITWDDCGCFYDQVPPGLNPDGSQRGPRVPLVIVSPYAKPGFTDSTSTTFAGILAYVEHTFGLAALGPNDAKAYPFTHSFNYSQVPLRPVPMVHRPIPRGDHIHWAQGRQDT